MKKATRALIITASLLFVATFVLGVIGVWNGDARFGETAVLLGFAGVIVGGAALIVEAP